MENNDKSYGDDILLFCVLPNEQYEMLEKEYEKTKLNRHFSKITFTVKMLSLQYDVILYAGGG